MVASLKSLLAGRTNLYAVDYHVKRAGGDWLWVHDRGELVQSDDGRAVVRGFVIDITERKSVEEQKILIALEKERRALLAQFIQNAAHEFKTPLSIISVNAELILQVSDAERQRQKKQQIDQQVWRMNKLVDMLLRMSGLDKAQALDKRPLNITTMVESLFADLQARANGRLTVRCEQDPSLPTIMGDGELIREALAHLVDNALHFTPAAGAITLCSFFDPPYAIVTVADTGPGIAEDGETRRYFFSGNSALLRPTDFLLLAGWRVAVFGW
jgi:signal transduction histidine kinase